MVEVWVTQRYGVTITPEPLVRCPRHLYVINPLKGVCPTCNWNPRESLTS